MATSYKHRAAVRSLLWEHILHWLLWQTDWDELGKDCVPQSDSFQTGFDTSSYEDLIKHSQKMFFLMFLISKSVQKNLWSQYQTTLLQNTTSCDYPRNPATPGRLNPFSHDKNFCVLNKKLAGNHHSTCPTSIKPPLHFPWNWCLRKIGQPAGQRAGYAGSILINDTLLQTPQLASLRDILF